MPADLESQILSTSNDQPPSTSHPEDESRESSENINNDDNDNEAGDDSELEDDYPRGHRLSTLPPPSDNVSASKFANHSGRQTGVKGVLDDRKFSSISTSLQQQLIISNTIAEQKKKGIISTLTIEEEEELKKREEREGERVKWLKENEEDVKARDKWRRARREEIEIERKRERDENNPDGFTSRKGLKEVGQEGFLSAVERQGWVIILIYEPDIPRCQALLASLLSLSLRISTNPKEPILLLRARATSLAFSLLPNTGSSGQSQKDDRTLNNDQEDDEDTGEEEGEGENGQADPDVLPSLLAYKDGELENTWIRVDWDVKEDGIEGLLIREGILKPYNITQGGEASNDED